jgi:hypothetical protein
VVGVKRKKDQNGLVEVHAVNENFCVSNPPATKLLPDITFPFSEEDQKLRCFSWIQGEFPNPAPGTGPDLRNRIPHLLARQPCLGFFAQRAI